jgi:hypothetical protein
MLIKQIYPEVLAVPSSYCKYFLRGEQLTGDAENAIVGAGLAVKNTGYLDSSLWANPGYMAVGGGAANYLTLDSATHDLTLNGFSLVITARILKSAGAFPASEQYIVNSYNPGANTGGIIISCRTDGGAKCYANATDGTTVGITSASGALTNGTTPTERSCVFVFPRESSVSAVIAIDGITSGSSAATTLAGKSLASGRAMRIGVTQAGGAVDAYKVAALGAYLVPRDMYAMDLNQIYDWAFRNPSTPMPDWVFA